MRLCSVAMRYDRLVGLCTVLALGCSESDPETVDPEVNIDPDNPEWRFEIIQHRTGDITFEDVWTNSRGDAFVVGWFGTIITNRNGTWEEMPTPTTENLTAIAGLNNGRRFRLEDRADGEMFAVGWNGTVLYYHPDPNGDEDPADGEWRRIAGPGPESETVSFFSPLLRIDPACPDFDGDGVPDDGNGDGWWGPFQGEPSICGTPGAPANCDDNCRTTPNGTLRPLRDTNEGIDLDADPENIGCLGPGDNPDPTESQLDVDMDGIGAACEDDDAIPEPAGVFSSTLFDVHAEFDEDRLLLVVVGENGSVLSYRGDSTSAAVRGTEDGAQLFGLEDPRGWIAQESVPFRFSTDDDCGDDPTLGGCGGRFFPSCPAQCNPIKTTCECLPEDGQCCDGGASTGAACVAGVDSCGPVENACQGNGNCQTLCPDCFRRLDQTLRSVAVSDDRVVAVGARGTIVSLELGGGPAVGPFYGVWASPSCASPAPPLDENPLLTAIDFSNGSFVTAGAAGSLFRLDVGEADCPAVAVTGAPPGFISEVEVLNGGRAFAVGDNGLFLELGGGAVNTIPTEVPENFLGLHRSVFEDVEGNSVERFWLVGATGRVVRAGFF